MYLLHLEDDNPLCDIMRLVIESLQSAEEIRFSQFRTADEALEHLRNEGDSVDLYLLDIRVPGTMNGIELAAEIREMGLTGTIIITSAYQMPEPALLKALGAMWLPKPAHVLDLNRKVIPAAREASLRENRRGYQG